MNHRSVLDVRGSFFVIVRVSVGLDGGKTGVRRRRLFTPHPLTDVFVCASLLKERQDATFTGFVYTEAVYLVQLFR